MKWSDAVAVVGTAWAVSFALYEMFKYVGH